MFIQWTLLVFSSLLFYMLGEITNRYILKEENSFLDSMMLGAVSTYVLFGLVHYILPLNLYNTLILFLILILLNFKKLKSIIVTFPSNRSIQLFLLLIVCMTPLILQLSHAGDHYLYHDQTVSWFNQFPVIQGLGNFHGRYAFNSAIFPLAAGFQLDQETNWYFLNVLFAVILIVKLFEFFTSKQKLFTKLLTVYFLLNILHYGIPYYSNVSPDFSVVVFISYVFLTILGAFNRKVGFMIVLLLFSTFIKLSILPVSGLMIAYFTFKFFRHYNPLLTLRKLGIPVVLCTVWFSRSFILSGQIIYPLPLLYSNFFQHSVSKSQVEFEKISVTGWAQNPGEGYVERYNKYKGTLKWFPSWWNRQANIPHAYYPITGKLSIRWFMIICILLGLIYLFRTNLFRPNHTIRIFTLFVILNILFWFINGPDYRFGFPLFILLFFGVLLHVKSRIIQSIAIIFILYTIPWKLFDFGRYYINSIKSANYTAIYGSDKTSKEVIKSYLFNSNKSDSLVYYYPKVYGECPTHVFPCAPSKINNVTYETSGSGIPTFYHK